MTAQSNLPRLYFLAEVMNKYPQISALVLGNTIGRLWVVGGCVVEVLVSKMQNPHHTETFDYRNLYFTTGGFPFRDMDFIAEGLVEDIQLSPGWKSSRNTFGGIKFSNANHIVDLWTLNQHEPFRRHAVERTIKNVLRLAPFTIQSIAIELETGEILGDAGMQAILTKTVAVNCLAEAEHYCAVYGTSIASYVQEKAEQFGFTPVLP